MLLVVVVVAASGAGRYAAPRTVLRGTTSRIRASDDTDDAVRAFREQLQRQMSGAPSASNADDDLWVRMSEGFAPGTMMVAHPDGWLEGGGKERGTPFETFGIRGPLPRDIAPDMLARVLPIVFITGTDGDQTTGFLLERRTGILLGDIQGSEYSCAPINVLWLGGIAARSEVRTLVRSESPCALEGLDQVMAGVHAGSWNDARKLIEEGTISPSRTMVFAGRTGALLLPPGPAALHVFSQPRSTRAPLPCCVLGSLQR